MSLGYKSSEVDSDVWMKRDFKPNVDPYYKYILCYVDDLLHIGFKPNEDIDELNMIYRLTEVFIPPDRYLSVNVWKVQFNYGGFVWSANCADYLKSAIENVDNSLEVDNMALNNYVDGHSPYSSRFGP